MSKFLDVSTKIQEVSNGYGEIDENLQGMFLDTFSTFIGIVKELQDGAYEDISSQQVKISVFEKLFDIDLRTTVLAIAEEGIKRNSENIDDANELNADADLLASIRENFDNYLKD